MGRDIRSLDVWVALSHCGDDAPGIDVVGRRLDEIVERGTEGAYLEWTVGPGVVERVAEGKIVRPIFEPGDALDLRSHEPAPHRGRPGDDARSVRDRGVVLRAVDVRRDDEFVQRGRRREDPGAIRSRSPTTWCRLHDDRQVFRGHGGRGKQPRLDRIAVTHEPGSIAGRSRAGTARRRAPRRRARTAADHRRRSGDRLELHRVQREPGRGCVGPNRRVQSPGQDRESGSVGALSASVSATQMSTARLLRPMNVPSWWKRGLGVGRHAPQEGLAQGQQCLLAEILVDDVEDVRAPQRVDHLMQRALGESAICTAMHLSLWLRTTFAPGRLIGIPSRARQVPRRCFAARRPLHECACVLKRRGRRGARSRRSDPAQSDPRTSRFRGGGLLRRAPPW